MVDRLAISLDIVRKESLFFEDDWWVMFSAAAVMSGAGIESIDDIDLLLSENDAKAMIARHDSVEMHKGQVSQRFRSDPFCRFPIAPMPIEVMANFHISVNGTWRRILPETRIESCGLFTPSIEEQIALYRLLDRKKDAQKIAALQAVAD